MLKGKKLSILGDSISTYRDASNNTAANATTYYNPYFYRDPFPLEKTYWMQVMNTFGMTLCVNNSWSGGNLSGAEDPDSGVNRVHQLSRDSGEEPDVVIVFMGINDLGRCVPLEVFAADYEKTLLTIGEKYPHAAVCCINLPDRAAVLKHLTEQFNAAIEEAARRAGERFFIADLFHSRLNNDFYYRNTVDGLHPDEDGMRIIAEVVTDAIKANVK
ncbi:MAG: SGNH/GDSL hydrolase family protein [Ruminococcaceae bacterium]|nr:SGNH/GDSL hydrolase family protein [Oscillospiraceae bacterium]